MMSTTKGIPKGFHTATPYMILNNASQAIEFYKQAFGATELYRLAHENGKIRHAQILIGDSPFMICDEYREMSPDHRSVQTLGGSPVHIFLYVEDADASFARAIDAGATVVMPVADREYGRSGGVKDPYGLTWWITTHKESASHA